MEATYYVLVHSGSGSMSECAEGIETFGPYTEDQAKAVSDKLDQVFSGFDEGLHSRILNVAKAKLDPTDFILGQSLGNSLS